MTVISPCTGSLRSVYFRTFIVLRMHNRFGDRIAFLLPVLTCMWNTPPSPSRNEFYEDFKRRRRLKTCSFGDHGAVRLVDICACFETTALYTLTRLYSLTQCVSFIVLLRTWRTSLLRHGVVTAARATMQERRASWYLFRRNWNQREATGRVVTILEVLCQTKTCPIGLIIIPRRRLRRATAIESESVMLTKIAVLFIFV